MPTWALCPGTNSPSSAGAPERGAVRQRRVEIGVPGVEVGVEVHQCDRAVPAMVGAQQRVGDGVVAAEGDQVCSAVDECECLLFDLPDGGGDVEGIADEVPGVDHLLTRER